MLPAFSNVSEKGTGRREMIVRLNRFVEARPFVSMTRNRKDAFVAAVGVPPTTPLLPSVSPGGSVFDTTAHV